MGTWERSLRGVASKVASQVFTAAELGRAPGVRAFEHEEGIEGGKAKSGVDGIPPLLKEIDAVDHDAD